MNEENIKITKSKKCIAYFKNLIILLCIFYALVFLLNIPFFVHMNFSYILKYALLTSLSLMIGHFILNGLYYLTACKPLAMGVLFIILGLISYMHTSLVLSILKFPTDITMDLHNTTVPFLSQYGFHFGLISIIIGGVLWYLTKKNKNTNYAAIYIYIITLAIHILFVGILDLGLTLLYIIIWMVLYEKLNENTSIIQNDDINILFKIIPTLSLLFITIRNYSLYRMRFRSFSGTNYVLIIYSVILFFVISFIVWRADIVKKSLPDSVNIFIDKIISLIKQFIFIKY
ncbi:hypothetical protein PV797_09935 [Clostridiaceae bacterium M8S5]|nr:hypothetical protein PV797_09935 [Clostridiaceae bacterium M8S5]